MAGAGAGGATGAATGATGAGAGRAGACAIGAGAGVLFAAGSAALLAARSAKNLSAAIGGRGAGGLGPAFIPKRCAPCCTILLMLEEFKSGSVCAFLDLIVFISCSCPSGPVATI